MNNFSLNWTCGQLLQFSETVLVFFQYWPSIISLFQKDNQQHILQLKSVEIAAQLTLHDFSIFRQVEPTEYVDDLYSLTSAYGIPKLTEFSKVCLTKYFIYSLTLGIQGSLSAVVWPMIILTAILERFMHRADFYSCQIFTFDFIQFITVKQVNESVMYKMKFLFLCNFADCKQGDVLGYHGGLQWTKYYSTHESC